MNGKNIVIAIALCACALSATAAPVLNVTPEGLQGGNWVWDVSVTPDLALAGGHTPLAVELGFRLRGDPLQSVTNVNPLVFDTNNPGKKIFGWEVGYFNPLYGEGLEVNCNGCAVVNAATSGGHAATVVMGSANEIFATFGSNNISTPGPVPFLRIIALGPGNGGPNSSTIEWLGAYNGNGRIAQLTTGPILSANFDIYAGTATQIPEPAGCVLLLIGSSLTLARRRARW